MRMAKSQPAPDGRLPYLMVIDSDGDIQYAHQGKLMNDIPDNSEVFAVLDRLNTETLVPETQ